MTKQNITVVGAGITGLWQALCLARAGHQLRLFEASSNPFAENASGLAGAMLAPHCEAEAAPPVVRELGLASLSLWRQTLPDVVAAGSLVLAGARDHVELNRFARMTDGHEVVDGERLADLEPDLAGRFAKGLYFPDEAHMAPHVVAQALLVLLREAGVEVMLGETWPRSDTAGTPKVAGREGSGDSDVIIDCRGLAARDDLPAHAPPLRGVRGERLILRSQDVTLSRPVRLLHPRHPLYVVPLPGDDTAMDALVGAGGGGLDAGGAARPGSYYMVGATVIESEDDGPMTVRSALELLGMAYALHPGFGEAEIIDMRAGLRPAFPDNAPKIIVRGRQIWVNGMFRHGFLVAPALGQLVADYLATGTVRDDVFVLE